MIQWDKCSEIFVLVRDKKETSKKAVFNLSSVNSVLFTIVYVWKINR